MFYTKILFLSFFFIGTAIAGPSLETRKLTPDDLAQNDLFGTSVSASNGIVLIGARLHDDPSLNAGAAYLFDISDGTKILKLVTSDNTGGGSFGVSVALNMSSTPPRAVVGKDRDREDGIDAGAVYVFNAITGDMLFKSTDPDELSGGLFGTSVDIDEDTIVVGAMLNNANGPGSGRAFVIDASNGDLMHILEPASPVNNSLFGNSVSISGDLILVGARREAEVGSNSGVAYLFDRTSGNQIARFFPADGSSGDQFGFSVSITDSFAAIGAVADGDNGSASGSVYIYDLSTPNSPVLTQKLLAPDGVSSDEFGYAVDLSTSPSGYRVAVGAWHRDEAASDSGAVYVFELSTNGSLESSSKFIASDGNQDAYLGASVTIDDTGDVIAGAPEDSVLGQNAGAAYVFSVNEPDCPADLNEDGQLDFFDVSVFLTAFQSQTPAGDFNNDGLYDFFDVSSFLVAFNGGCP